MTFAEFENRLACLEKCNRQPKAVALICVLGIVAFAVMGAGQTAPKTLEVQKIILKDALGNERGQLFTTDTAWGLVLFNKDGSKSSSVFVTRDTNGIILNDPNGNQRQVLNSDLNQSQFEVFKPGSDSAQIAFTDNAGGTGLVLRDRANVGRIGVGVSEKGAVIDLADKNGRTRAMMEDGRIGFAMLTGDGDLKWSPDWDKFSAEEKAKMRSLMPKIP
jgi:hypothetical protein